MPKGLLSFRQAARLLGVDRNTTLKQLVARGYVATVKVGKRYYIPAGQLAALIAGTAYEWQDLLP